MKLAYLAHPYSKRDEGERFQHKLETYNFGIKVLNPFQRGEQAIYSSVVARGEGFDKATCNLIVSTDLRKIDESDLLVALCIDDGMVGTLMEIFYASYHQWKPVYILAGNERYKKHPWLNHLGFVYDHEKPLIDALGVWALAQEALDVKA